MQPLDARAESDPRGGRILLTWTNPPLPGFKGTRVLRRESTFPDPSKPDARTTVIFDDAITPAGQSVHFLDLGTVSGSRTVQLKGETIYYYAIVSYDTASRPFPAFVSAIATAPYQTGAFLYNNLPGVYQGFDTTLPPASPALDPADATKGQLLRLLEMFGLQFDLLRSFASGMRDFHFLDRVDSSLLPLLAEWIGWQTNFALPIAKQRNEVKYAPPYWATIGIAANLRATINRLVTWDARFKEFAHNIFISNNPEQLAIYEVQRKGAIFDMPRPVTPDVVFEGRPAACLAPDSRPVIFYHALQSAPMPSLPGRPPVFEDRFHLWYKIFDRDDWLPAHRLTWDPHLNRSPAVFQKNDGTFWLFWTSYEPVGTDLVARLRLQQLTVGRAALSARIVTTTTGPFALDDGDVLRVIVTTGAINITRDVAFHGEDFVSIAQAQASEIAVVLNREIPGLDASITEDGTIRFLSHSAGASAAITIPASTAASKLGLAGLTTVTGVDAVRAILTGTGSEPFSLASGDILTFTMDGNTPREVTFSTAQFQNIGAATAAEVASAVNLVVPGTAEDAGGRVRLVSLQPGEASLVALDINRSTAAPKLGFATPLPAPAGKDDAEPAAFEDATRNVWMFFSSLRSGVWKIWYTRFNGTVWGTPKPLTEGNLPDREPAVVFDPAAGGRIWVFWSRKKASGLWNIFSRRTTHLDFDTLADADWTEEEMAPALANFDNREPAPLLAGPDNIDLYFSSNRANGFHVWQKTIGSVAQGADTSVTSGQFTYRAPAPLALGSGNVSVWVRSNESQVYSSSLYPSAITIDTRYAGSITSDTRNPTRLSLRRNFRDIQCYTYDTPRQGSSLFGVGDIANVASLVAKLESDPSPATHPVSQFIWGQFEPVARQLLADPNATLPQRQSVLIKELNTILRGNSIYESTRFADVTLRAETQLLIAQNPTAERLISLNRLLLEDAYLLEIARSPRQDPLQEATRLYSRDTVGIYLTPDTNDEQLIVRSQELIANVLRRFLPIQARAVFLIDLAYREFVYSYDDPQSAESHLIEDRMIDTILGEIVRNNLAHGFEDRASFRFLRTFAAGLTSGVLPDLAVVPPDLSSRLPIQGVKEGA